MYICMYEYVCVCVFRGICVTVYIWICYYISGNLEDWDTKYTILDFISSHVY